MYTTTNTPYNSVYEIGNADYKKHEMRVEKLHKDAYSTAIKGKSVSYEEECERLANIQVKKITDLRKMYGRYLVADDLGYVAIGNAFLRKYRNATQTRVEKISNILDFI
jgi:hypothetical protein